MDRITPAQYYEVVKPQRRGKYNAIKTEYNGHTYDSKHEAHVAEMLDLRKKEKNPADRILSVTPHPKRFSLRVNDVLVSSYTPDFMVEYASGKVEYIDAKSEITRKKNDYVIRKKLMRALYGIEIIEL